MYFNRFLAVLILSNSALSIAHSETFNFDDAGLFFRGLIQHEIEYTDDESDVQEDSDDAWVTARRNLYQVGDQIFSPAPTRVRERQDDDDGFEEGTPVKRPRTEELNFFRAVQNADIAQIVAMAELPGFDVNARNEVGATALHIAAGANLIEVVVLLLELGADPLMQNASGETPEQKALGYEYAELAQVLRNFAANQMANAN